MTRRAALLSVALVACDALLGIHEPAPRPGGDVDAGEIDANPTPVDAAMGHDGALPDDGAIPHGGPSDAPFVGDGSIPDISCAACTPFLLKPQLSMPVRLAAVGNRIFWAAAETPGMWTISWCDVLADGTCAASVAVRLATMSIDSLAAAPSGQTFAFTEYDKVYSGDLTGSYKELGSGLGPMSNVATVVLASGPAWLIAVTGGSSPFVTKGFYTLDPMPRILEPLMSVPLAIEVAKFGTTTTIVFAADDLTSSRCDRNGDDGPCVVGSLDCNAGTTCNLVADQGFVANGERAALFYKVDGAHVLLYLIDLGTNAGVWSLPLTNAGPLALNAVAMYWLQDFITIKYKRVDQDGGAQPFAAVMTGASDMIAIDSGLVVLATTGNLLFLRVH
jgi:hypothetical protein